MTDPVAAPTAAAALADPVAAPAPAAVVDPVAAPAPVAAAITLPAKDAAPDAWKAFYKSIGAPEKGEGYELKVPEGGNPEFAKEAATVMADVGLLPHQAAKLAEWWNSKTASATEAQTTAATKAANDAAIAKDAAAKTDDAALKNEWQGNYDKNIEAGKRAVRQFFPAGKQADVLTAIENAVGFGATMRMMQKLGAGLAEGEMRGAGDGGTHQVKSIAERLYPTAT